jgi:hypothetical protein
MVAYAVTTTPQEDIFGTSVNRDSILERASNPLHGVRLNLSLPILFNSRHPHHLRFHFLPFFR